MIGEIEAIFLKLEEHLRKSPKKAEKYIGNAKQSIINLISQNNYDMFSELLEQMTPVALDFD